MPDNDVRFKDECNIQGLSAAGLLFSKGSYDGVTESKLSPGIKEITNILSHDGRSYYDIPHKFNTSNVNVQILEEVSANTFETIYTPIEVTSSNVKVYFTTFTPSGNYRVIVSSASVPFATATVTPTVTPTITPSTTPPAVLSAHINVVQFSSENSAIFVKNGTAYGIGRNFYGELGQGNTSQVNTPTAVLSVTGTVTNIHSAPLSAGASCVFINSSGRVWVSGSNAAGRLGISNGNSNVTTPAELTSLDGAGIAAASITGTSTLFWSSSTKKVYGVGTSTLGVFGTGPGTTTYTTPTELTAYSSLNVRSIHVSSFASDTCLFTTDSGEVYAAGVFAAGMVNQNSLVTQYTPYLVPSLSSYTIVSAALGKACAFYVTSSGTVLVGGSNADGQLGIGATSNTSANSYAFVALTSLSSKSIIKVSSSSTGSTIFLARDGSVWATGDNTYGQLGLGDTTNRNVPTEITSLAGKRIMDISCGPNSTWFYAEDGTYWACGDNTYKQLSDGTTTQRNTPVQATVP
jgi:alpha-tubulin suppressor-like RCC1 family protein